MARWGAWLFATVMACAPPLEPGEWGTVRYFGDLLGEPPMRLLPPMTDREGTVYVLQGAPDRVDTQVYVGTQGGSWSRGCAAHRGLSGLHGFVGRTTDRVWYWAGTALVEVDGSTGACREVLPTDPTSGTELSFFGVAPHVDETPSRRFVTALVQGATGRPQFVLVDLDRRLPFNAVPLPVEDAFEVVATGAWTEARRSVFVVESGGASVAYVVDRLGQIVAEVPVDASRDLEAYEVPSFLQFSGDGVGVGVTARGRVLIVTDRTAGLIDAPFEPEGVLSLEGRVFVTGGAGAEAVMAPVSAGGIGSPVPFEAARRATERLSSSLAVQDERGSPARVAEWDVARSAIGTTPLISEWPLDRYTIQSTGWLVAGPSFPSGVEPVSAVGFVPVGVSAP